MHRRRFLKLASAAAAALGLPVPAAATAPARHVVVVGSGPAGMSAALELASRGVKVTLLEADEQLGGKVKGWTVPLGGAEVDVEHGIHGFAEGYVHFTELLERFGLDALREPRRSENGIRRPGGVALSTAPLGEFLDLVRDLRERSKAMGYRRFLAEWRQGRRWVRGLTREEARARWGGMSVPEYYATQDVPLTRYRLMMDVFARSLYFVEADQLDAGMWAISERWNGLRVRWMRGNPQERIWEPFGRILRDLGADVRLRSRVSELLVEEGRVVGVRVGDQRPDVALDVPAEGWRKQDVAGEPYLVGRVDGAVKVLSARCTHAGCPVDVAPDGFACPCHGGRYDAAGLPVAGPPKNPLAPVPATVDGDRALVAAADDREALRADAVVLAVDAPALAALAGGLIPRLQGLRATRHTVARYWFDRDVDPRADEAALLDGFPHASNGFLVHRLQDRARDWAAATGGSVIEIQAFRDLPEDASVEALLDAIEADVRSCWPELADAKVLERQLVDGRKFTWFFPGWHEHAVEVETGVPGLYAAGDHLLVDRDCEFMERAVYTGRLAANAILAEAGLPQAPILDDGSLA